MRIVAVDAGECLDLLAGLRALVRDAVDGGASIGFLAPMEHGEAARYWREVAEGLDADTILLVALDGPEVAGAVQLARCEKANGRHRAEVRKLMVRRDRRGRGLGRSLMLEVEKAALSMGIGLLTLDTAVGEVAEAMYERMGWISVGRIPGYAANTDGTLHPASFFYKDLGVEQA